MNIDKQIDEMRHLADEMGKAISNEYERRVLADERKLEAVLKENGWRKSSDTIDEFAERLSSLLDEEYRKHTPEGADNFFKNGSLMMWGIAKWAVTQIAKEMKGEGKI